MENKKEIRWKQRFEDFKKSLQKLRLSLEKETPDEVYRAGIIQFFEMTFELGWKLIKDYLESEGHLVNSPRNAIQTAFNTDVIEDGHIWIDALEKRKLLAHTYDEKRAIEAENLIRKSYFGILQQLEIYLNAKK